jgi:hypothetical protein
MSADQLIKEIKALSEDELLIFLNRLFADKKMIEEIENLNYLKLTEKSFDFWNDTRENVYQDYSRKK